MSDHSATDSADEKSKDTKYGHTHLNLSRCLEVDEELDKAITAMAAKYDEGDMAKADRASGVSEEIIADRCRCAATMAIAQRAFERVTLLGDLEGVQRLNIYQVNFYMCVVPQQLADEQKAHSADPSKGA